jgi:hypothetical protein
MFASPCRRKVLRKAVVIHCSRISSKERLMISLLHTRTWATPCFNKAGDSRRSTSSNGLACSEASVKLSNDSLHSYKPMFIRAWTWLEIPQGRQATMFLACSETIAKISNNCSCSCVLLSRKYFHYVKQPWKRITNIYTGDKSLICHAVIYEIISKAAHIINLDTRWNHRHSLEGSLIGLHSRFKQGSE